MKHVYSSALEITHICDLFANILGHHFVACIIVYLTQPFPYAFKSAQSPGAEVSFLVPYEETLEPHDRTGLEQLQAILAYRFGVTITGGRIVQLLL